MPPPPRSDAAPAPLPSAGALAAWLPRQRWFAAKTRRIAAVAVDDTVPVGPGALAIVRVTLDDGTADRYAVALPASEAGDALGEPAYGRALLDLVARGREAAGARGVLRGRPTSVFPAPLPADLPVRRLAGEQSHTSLVFGRALIMKHFRRLAEGVNPEEEVGRFLTERARFDHAPRLAGHLEYRAASAALTVAVVHELIEGARDGWEWALEALAGFHARAAGPVTPERVRVLAGPALRALRRLGQVTGSLHRALASDPHEPAFAPEPIGPDDLARWAQDVARQVDAARRLLGDGAPAPPDLGAGLEALRGCVRIRLHGDLHLGQTLYRPATGDFAVIDFEGEPLRPLAERRRKHAALRDVAGVVRSIDYAAAASLRPDGPAGAPAGDRARWAEAWRAEAVREFLDGYRAATAGAPFVPASAAAFARAVAVFELEKAAYEVVYEANHRPDWLPIPRQGLVRASARLTAGAAGAA